MKKIFALALIFIIACYACEKPEEEIKTEATVTTYGPSKGYINRAGVFINTGCADPNEMFDTVLYGTNYQIFISPINNDTFATTSDSCFIIDGGPIPIKDYYTQTAKINFYFINYNRTLGLQVKYRVLFKDRTYKDSLFYCNDGQTEFPVEVFPCGHKKFESVVILEQPPPPR